jgi:prepilin-type N-terminal cleavage/methylation domain-containing protein
VTTVTIALDLADDPDTSRLPRKDAMRSLATNQPFHNAGFSLVELSIVMALALALCGFAVLNMSEILPGMQANEAMYQTVAQLRRGRESAVAQRRNIEVRFLGDNQIQLVRHDVPAGTTILSTVELSDKSQFQLFDGVPDSPDSFGNGAAVDFGGSATLTFQTDGTFVDNQGNPLNGSVFIGLPDHPGTARAVTILGATGRVRSYRWTGNSWIQ